MSEQPEIVTNPRSLLFGAGLTLVIAAFGAQISNWPLDNHRCRLHRGDDANVHRNLAGFSGVLRRKNG